MTSSTASASATLPTTLSELILPFQLSLGQTLTSLKKSRLSIHNRLLSILEDSQFVTTVAQANRLPLVANERCGSWYVPPSEHRGSVYFKSTDGHQGQWSFNLRRLNLPLLEILGNHGGAIIVDSTRRGKSMPDALSKTVAIWVAVMNRVLFPECVDAHELSTPEDVVGRSEHAQIERKIESFVRDFKSLELDSQRFRDTVKKPIRLHFISRQSAVLRVQQDSVYQTLICCSASRHEHGDGDAYVQGAGDDTENWAHGLTARLFWSHQTEILLERNEEKLMELIQGLISQEHQPQSTSALQVSVNGKPTGLFIAQTSIASTTSDPYDAIIWTGRDPEVGVTDLNARKRKPVLSLDCIPGKLGGKALRTKLDLLNTFLPKLLELKSNPKILIVCTDGKDLSIGVALAIICRYVDDQAQLKIEPADSLSKTFIKQRLAGISQSVPAANPSRATLQSVNTYLMGHKV